MQLNISLETNHDDVETCFPGQELLLIQSERHPSFGAIDVTEPRPTVEQVLLAILADSKIGSAQFAVRSNVRHDGE